VTARQIQLLVLLTLLAAFLGKMQHLWVGFFDGH
jgi:hypothetical protein